MNEVRNERNELNAPSGSVFVVVIEDRHADVDVEIWNDKEAAINRGRELAKKYCRHEDDYEEEQISDWLFYARYSCEDDSCRVIERKILFTEH